MELVGPWQAIVADDDLRRTWLDDGSTPPAPDRPGDARDDGSDEYGAPDARDGPGDDHDATRGGEGQHGGGADRGASVSADGPTARESTGQGQLELADERSTPEPTGAREGDAGDLVDLGDERPPAVWADIAVPGHWQSTDAFAEAEGPLLYRTHFHHDPPADDERLWLRFDGVFYQGDVWLDGGYVGDTEGYFFPHTYEVTEALAARTEHTLGIEVTCSPQRDRTAKRNITGVFQHWNSADPDANPGGIWRPVSIERTGRIRIRHLRVICREANETQAQVSFRAVLDAAEAGEVVLRSAIGDTELIDRRRLAAGENQVEWTVRVDEPELWWPHALGEPVLHDVVVEVTPCTSEVSDDEDEGEGESKAHGDEADDRNDDGAVRAGSDADQAVGGDGKGDAVGQIDDRAPGVPDGPVSHRVTRRIGLRQVHLRGWVLHINGERIFAKGANLGPTTMALGEATDDDLRRDVALAKDANLDLVRVNGHITRTPLYDAADEAGMLVWQDFPLQWGYSRTIRKQAQRQAREAVDLLGHHPSLVVWCGHNEPFALDIEPGDGEVGTFTSRGLAAQELPGWNKTLLDRSVKRTIVKADGSRPVIAHSGVLPHPPQLDGTDSHLSFGWTYGETRDLGGFARLFPRLVRFVGEFGAQAVPETADFCEPERWPDLDWERLARTHGMQTGIFAERVPPADHPSFDSWRRATQAYQADLITHQVETMRRLKYRPTGGFAQFFLADGGPAISWSVLDHERRPKAGYLALRDACRPVIVVADRLPAEVKPGDTLALDIHVINDLRRPVEDIEVTAALTWSDGEQRWRYGGTVDTDAVIRVGTLPIEVPDARGPATLTLRLSGADVPDGPIERTDRTQIVRR